MDEKRLEGSTINDALPNLLDLLGGDVSLDCSTDGKVLWVNRNGICIMRISGMYSFVVNEHLEKFSDR